MFRRLKDEYHGKSTRRAKSSNQVCNCVWTGCNVIVTQLLCMKTTYRPGALCRLQPANQLRLRILTVKQSKCLPRGITAAPTCWTCSPGTRNLTSTQNIECQEQKIFFCHVMSSHTHTQDISDLKKYTHMSIHSSCTSVDDPASRDGLR